MGMTYLMLSLFTTICTSVITSYLYRAIFRPSGWTKKENEGVAVRFKVFLSLYLQNPEKWKLMPDAARYENMMVYFSTGLQWRKYNRWRKRVRKQRQKAEQEERKQKFMDAIFKEYEPKPKPEFTPPPTVKPKTDKDKPTNAELDKIRADLMLTAQAQEKRSNPRCMDCVHMRYRHDCNGKIDTVCVKHRTAIGFEPIWPEMTACGIFEPKIKTQTIKRPEPLGTVTTH